MLTRLPSLMPAKRAPRADDIIPDWAILVLAVLVVAVVYSLFGGFGVLVLGIVATGAWIAQIKGSAITVRE